MIWVSIFLTLLLIASLGLNYVLWRGGANALSNLDRLNEFVFNVQQQLEYVTTTIKRIDAAGAFEIDDEVGVTFKAIKEVVLSLDNFIEKESTAVEGQE